MATTYIEGPTLAQRIARRGPIGGAELRSLAIGLAEALRDIHRADVVHRDLKPSNVVLSAEGPRVIDFGISRAADQQTLTMTGRVIGTPPFMSPEQLQTPRGVGPSSDVFSLGTLLVYAATGQGPFDADSPYMTAYQVVHEAPALDSVPQALRAAVEPCLAKDPAARPSVDELLVLLRDLPAELEVLAGGGRTRDVATEHQLGRDTGAGAPAGTGASAAEGAGPGARASGSGMSGADGSGGGKSGGSEPEPGADAASNPRPRRFRRRWRPLLAAAAVIGVVAAGVVVLDAGPDSTPAGPDGKGRNVAATGAAALPGGFRPWRQDVPAGKAKIPDEVRCLPGGDSVYCGGGGVVATRVRVADGKRLWTTGGPGVPVQDLYLAGLATADGRGKGDRQDPAPAKDPARTVIGYRPAAEGSGRPDEVVALDAARGKELWSAPFGIQSVAVAGPGAADAVVIGSTVLTADAGGTRVEGRDARSGRTLWTVPFPAGDQCAPLGAGGRAYLMCAPKAQLTAGEVRRVTVRAVDLASGDLGRSFGVAGPVEPLGADHGQLVLARRRAGEIGVVEYDAVVRLDQRRGKATTTRLPRAYGGAPRLVDGAVYFTEQSGKVSAVDAASGRPRWARHTGVEGASGPSAGPGALYFGSAGGRVAALAPRDGKRLWSTDPKVNGGSGLSPTPRVTFAGRAAIVSGASNLLYAFDTAKPPKSG
ncbi:serine/threonine protein kinase [Streptomyces aureoverticillatus]|nr:serine/threonine protein kinase [Streptomyces aureoverticillatus]